jgi:Ufm1-specific protease 2
MILPMFTILCFAILNYFYWQCILVKLDDKPRSFIGSNTWIGSTEVGFVLEHLLQVQSRFVIASNGAELPIKGADLLQHFRREGTPVMMGGGALAHTLLGVSLPTDSTKGDVWFLTLDPHYTGADDVLAIQTKVHACSFVLCLSFRMCVYPFLSNLCPMNVV